MTPKQQRMLSVGMLVAGLALVSALSIGALRENTGFYLELDEIAAGEYPTDRRFRVGGLVEAGSLEREPGSLELQFTLTDTANTLVVSYSGVLPDLFRDGQGIIAHGRGRRLRRRRSAGQARRELHAARGRGLAGEAGLQARGVSA